MNYSNPETVPHNWNVGDVILDLYEVKPVTEGFGAASTQRDYHQGGFGRVYKVWHLGWNREMAVKIAREQVFKTQAQKEVFTRECETWVDLGLHMNIAACHYVRDLGGVPRVFSEYAPAGTLQDWITSKRLYQGTEKDVLARIFDVSIQFAWGLHYAHEHGVIHQDVKPLNALMWDDETLKVSDFGLARARTKSGLETVADKKQSILVSSGPMTPPYCSPEQKAGEKLGRGTDIWSWAVSVLQMFVGEITWESGVIAPQALEFYLENGGEIGGIPAMPNKLTQLIRRCFKQQQSERMRTMLECGEAIIEIYRSEIGNAYNRNPSTVVEDADLLNNKALSFIDLGKSTQARDLLQKALAGNRNHIKATYNYGLLRWRAAEITDEIMHLTLDGCGCPKADLTYLIGKAFILFESGCIADARDILMRSNLQDDVFAQSFVACNKSFLETYSNTKTSQFSIPDTFVHDVSFDANEDAVILLTQKTLQDPFIQIRVDVHTGRVTFTEVIASLDKIKTKQANKYANDPVFGSIKTFDTNITFNGYSPVSEIAITNNSCFAVTSSFLFDISGPSSYDPAIRIWHIPTRRCLRTLKEHKYDNSKILIAQSDTIFVTIGEDCKIIVYRNFCFESCGLRAPWLYSEPKPIREISLNERRHKGYVRISEDAVRDGNIETALTNICLALSVPGFGTNAYALDVKYGIGENLNVKKCHDSWLKCTFPVRLSTSDKLYPPAVTSVDWSPTGKCVIAINCHDWVFGLWDINTKKCIRRFAGHKDCVLAAKYLKKSNAVISGSADWTIKKWNPSANQEVSTFSDGKAESISALAVSADETMLLEASSTSKPIYPFNKKRHAFRLWNLKTNSLVQRFYEHSEPLHANGLAISPDGTMAITAGYDNAVMLHKLDGKYVDHKILETSQFWTNAVCFSPDGRLAVWASDNDVKVYDIKSKRINFTLQGHSNIVKCVSFHKCGKFLLTGSRDETIKLWDLSIGSCVKSFDVPGGDVISLAFSPNCRYAVSGGEQGSVSIWEFDWDYETAVEPKVEQKRTFFRLFSKQ